MQKKCQRRIDTIFLVKAVSRIVATKMLSALRTTPLGVMLVAVIAFSQIEALPTTFSTSIPTISYMILVFAMAVTSCFSRSRFFFISLILFLSQLGINSFTPGYLGKNFAFEIMYSFISFLLPLNILFFSSLAERGILSGSGQRNFLLIILQVAFIKLLILSENGEFLNKINGKFVLFSFMPQTPLPQIAVIVFLIAGALLLMRRRRATIHFKIALFGVLVTIALAHHFNNIPIAIPLFYAAAGLIIIVSVIQDYYFKAYLDELTALPSRRSLNEDMMKLDGVYAIAMVDVDFFKRFNDTYGHDAGDDVLRLIARFIGECKNGKAFRYGGEEFTILFPRKSLTEVTPYLEEIREKIAKSNFVVRSEDKNGKEINNRLNITVSIGAAEATHKSITPDEVIKAADTALYRAKDQGRNCVCMSIP